MTPTLCHPSHICIYMRYIHENVLREYRLYINTKKHEKQILCYPSHICIYMRYIHENVLREYRL